MERRERNGREHRCRCLISWPVKTDKRIITITTIFSRTFLCHGEKKRTITLEPNQSKATVEF